MNKNLNIRAISLIKKANNTEISRLAVLFNKAIREYGSLEMAKCEVCASIINIVKILL